MALVSKTTLHKAKVIKDILPIGKVITGAKITPKEICIHNTGMWNVPAKNFNSSIKNNNKGTGRDASWHFTVDDKEIYQHADTTSRTWHAGSGNNVAIGIEICMFKDSARQKLAEDNAAALVKELMSMHKITSYDKVKMHKDYTGKNCPEVFISRDGGISKFKERIKSIGGSTSTPSNTNTSVSNKVKYSNGSYNKTATVTANLNVRYERGNTNSKILGTLEKGSKIVVKYCLDNWFSIDYKGGKDGVGYISGEYVEIVDVNSTQSTTPQLPSTTAPFKNGSYNVEATTTANLNIRYERANTNSKVLGTLTKGRTVTVKYCLNNWFSIDCKGGKDGVGYICGDYIKLK